PADAHTASIAAPELTPETKRALMKRIRATVGSASKISLIVGNPVRDLLRLVRTRNADLVVMATHGRAGLKRVLLGSVTEAVARQSPAPVLAVRGEYAEIRGVLCPVNFTDYSYYGFTYAAALAAALGAPLTALHVHVDPVWNGDPQRKLERLMERVPAALRGRCRSLVETGETDAARGIAKAAAKNDLIVLVAHEKAPVKEMILGTTAERVLRQSRSPVLIVPAPTRPLPTQKDLPAPCCAAV
ncbi:MAG: universal stress protein, partial [Elusimicrobiota bacterium]